MRHPSQHKPIGPFATLLASTLVVLIAFYGQYIFGVLLVFLIIKYSGKFVWNCIKCKHCGGSGKVDGYDHHLKVHFHQARCYVCNGTGLPKSDIRKKWYKFSIASQQQLERLYAEEQAIYAEIINYQQSMNVSIYTPESVLIAFETVIQQKNAQLRIVETEQKLYQRVLQQSMINIQTIHLLHLSQQQKIKVEVWEERTWDGLQRALTFVEEAKLEHRMEILPLGRGEVNSYRELLSEKMRKDLEHAATEFCELIEYARRA